MNFQTNFSHNLSEKYLEEFSFQIFKLGACVNTFKKMNHAAIAIIFAIAMARANGGPALKNQENFKESYGLLSWSFDALFYFY